VNEGWTVKSYRYPAIQVRQTPKSNGLVLFAASAAEIDEWAGAPQKKELDGSGETTGFQRDINTDRLENLGKFYNDERNTIQNPLLCSSRYSAKDAVQFTPAPGVAIDQVPVVSGVIEIRTTEIDKLPLLEIMRRVKADLERRVPALAATGVPASKIVNLKQRIHAISSENADQDEDTRDNEEVNDDLESGADTSALMFSDESHILEFWEDLSVHIAVLDEAGPEFQKGESFEGFTRDAMIAFLRPVVLVDGQHRLRGAVDVAKKKVKEPPFSSEITQAIIDGQAPGDVQQAAMVKASRVLPVSMLMTDDPAEHVFQFVVVNQKATPIDSALLGTIVSTSLSNEELERVADRLKNAGIPLSESRAIAYLSRNPDSPFFKLVQRGLTSDGHELMPWTVLRSLIGIFQNLRGGKLYHEKNDYAAVWRKKCLQNSGLVNDYATKGFSDPLKYWSAPDGPWREVFVQFYRSIRDKFGSRDDTEAPNYWGENRSSNLFNKISLTILAADFFQFLSDGKRVIDSADQVSILVNEWLQEVDENYFNRNWKLSGVKKESPGIRSRWAKVWAEYRRNPEKLPSTNEYRKPLNAS
jgi:hypothetical protein